MATDQRPATVDPGTGAAPSRAPWWSTYAGPLLVAGGVLAAGAYVAFVDPNDPGHYPFCPLKAWTGLDCPGCGGLRAVHALLHGDVGTALDQNLFVVLLVLPASLVMWLAWLARIRAETSGAARPALAARSLWQRWAPYAFLVVMIVFTVVRNLPWVPYLRSGIG